MVPSDNVVFNLYGHILTNTDCKEQGNAIQTFLTGQFTKKN